MRALALKYRPTSFADLVGQVHAARSLQNAIKFDQVGHAYLFFGSRGVGKTSMARILAKCLNCEQGPTVTPDETCDNCREISDGSSLDVLEMDAASNRGIEHIRELRESVRFAPMKSKYKIYIIDEVHMLTNESFNALLKTLEEPPEHVVFIMATTEQHKIPETILSRCQAYAFRKFTVADIIGRLQTILEKEKIEFDENVLHPVAQRAEGSMRDAISILDQLLAYSGGEKLESKDATLVLGLIPTRLYLEFLEAIRKKDLKMLLHMLQEVHNEGYDLKRFLWDFLDMVKGVVLLKHNLTDDDIASLLQFQGDELKKILANWDATDLNMVFDDFYKLYSNWTLFQTSKSSEIKVSIELALIELFHKLEQPSVSRVLQKISGLSRALESDKPFKDESAKAPPPGKEAIDDVDTLIQKEFMGREEESPLADDVFK